MNEEFKGIWISKDVWLLDDLTILEKLFLIEINFMDKEQGCFASNQHFSDFFKISKGRCSQIIKSLESKKYITINLEREGRMITKRVVKILNRGIKFSKHPIKNIKHPIKYSKQGYLENAQENNISINNTINNSVASKNSTQHKDEIQIEIKEKKDLVDKIKKEKKVASQKRKKETANWAKEWATIFDEVYRGLIGVSYQFTGKDFSNLQQLKKKLSGTFRDRQHRLPDGEELQRAYAWLLRQAIKDKWIVQNLSPSIINSKYNEIIAKSTNAAKRTDAISDNETLAEVERLLNEED